MNDQMYIVVLNKVIDLSSNNSKLMNENNELRAKLTEPLSYRKIHMIKELRDFMRRAEIHYNQETERSEILHPTLLDCKVFIETLMRDLDKENGRKE